MSYYRLYFWSNRTGRIERFEEFEAQDDIQALGMVEPRLGDQISELWNGSRKVRKFDPASSRHPQFEVTTGPA